MKKTGTPPTTASSGPILVAVRFAVHTNARFLSHAETLRLFQRACVRAGITLRYSQGFNPHPKISLPLPRSTGVETDDDLLCLQLIGPADSSRASFDTETFTTRLAQQLPEGFELLSVETVPPNTSFEPVLASYVLHVLPEYALPGLERAAEDLMASERLEMERIDSAGRTRRIDVRPFLGEIDIKGSTGPASNAKTPLQITVCCRITSAGTIRVDEIMKLLRLQTHMLAAPIRRTHIDYRRK